MEDLRRSSSSRSAQSEEENGAHNVRDFDLNQPAPEAGDDHLLMGRLEEVVEGNSTGTSRRRRLSPKDPRIRHLEARYNQNRHINRRERDELAARLDLAPRQVAVWFQNRRARARTQQREITLDRADRSLTERLERLERDVDRLQRDVGRLQGDGERDVERLQHRPKTEH